MAPAAALAWCRLLRAVNPFGVGGLQPSRLGFFTPLVHRLCAVSVNGAYSGVPKPSIGASASGLRSRIAAAAVSLFAG